jgi:hypothetical protein
MRFTNAGDIKPSATQRSTFLLKAWTTKEGRPLRDECVAQQLIELLVDQRVGTDCQSDSVK